MASWACPMRCASTMRMPRSTDCVSMRFMTSLTASMRQNRETQHENDEKRAQGKHAKYADMRGCRTGVDSKLSRFRFGRVSLADFGSAINPRRRTDGAKRLRDQPTPAYRRGEKIAHGRTGKNTPILLSSSSAWDAGTYTQSREPSAALAGMRARGYSPSIVKSLCFLPFQRCKNES